MWQNKLSYLSALGIEQEVSCGVNKGIIVDKFASMDKKKKECS